jgi:hypothetical protein
MTAHGFLGGAFHGRVNLSPIRESFADSVRRIVQLDVILRHKIRSTVLVRRELP